MRAAGVVLAAFCLLAVLHVSVARAHARQGKHVARAEVSPREERAHPRREEEEEKAEGLIPVEVGPTEDTEEETKPVGPKKTSRMPRKKKSKLRKQADKNKKDEDEPEKKKKTKQQKIEMKKRRKMRRRQRKLKKLAERKTCNSDADCPESCCLKKKGMKKKFCSKPMARTESQNCKRSCQCKSDLACFIENKPSSPRHRRKAMGVCANPDTADLSKGYILDRNQQGKAKGKAPE